MFPNSYHPDRTSFFGKFIFLFFTTFKIKILIVEILRNVLQIPFIALILSQGIEAEKDLRLRISGVRLTSFEKSKS